MDFQVQRKLYTEYDRICLQMMQEVEPATHIQTNNYMNRVTNQLYLINYYYYSMYYIEFE